MVIMMGLVWSLMFSAIFCLVVFFCQQTSILLGLSWLCVFSIMTGLGLVIGNAITLALEPHQRNAGVAASVLGFLYYIVIAVVAAGMAYMHDGSIYAMPYYWLKVLGLASIVAYHLRQEENAPVSEVLES